MENLEYTQRRKTIEQEAFKKMILPMTIAIIIMAIYVIYNVFVFITGIATVESMEFYYNFGCAGSFLIIILMIHPIWKSRVKKMKALDKEAGRVYKKDTRNILIHFFIQAIVYFGDDVMNNHRLKA